MLGEPIAVQLWLDRISASWQIWASQNGACPMGYFSRLATQNVHYFKSMATLNLSS